MKTKVYVVEVGAYSDRYIDAIFTTRELAEAFVADRQRRVFERRAEWPASGWTIAEPAETFEEFVRRHESYDTYEFGGVEEYDIWDALPVVPEGADR